MGPDHIYISLSVAGSYRNILHMSRICQGYFFWLVNITYKISKTTRKSDKTAQQNLNFSPAALVFPSFNIMTYLKTTRKFHALLTRMRINAKNTLKMSGIFYILSEKCQAYVRDIFSCNMVATLYGCLRGPYLKGRTLWGFQEGYKWPQEVWLRLCEAVFFQQIFWFPSEKFWELILNNKTSSSFLSSWLWHHSGT